MKPRILFLSLKFLLALVAISLCRQTSAATFPVADGDVAALIAAINTSNSNGDDDTIELATNGTYTLTAVDNSTNGLPVIGSDTAHKLVIHGNGATLQRSTAVGTPFFRIFQIGADADVTIAGLTITNGAALGGGISNGTSPGVFRATLTVNNCTVSGNTCGVKRGGGIYNGVGATLTVNNCTISGNTGVEFEPPGAGGGIFNDNGTATITNSTLSGNSAPLGGGIYNQGFLRITNSTLSGNSARATGGGGAIFDNGAFGSGVLQIGNTILKTGASGQNIVDFQAGAFGSLGYNLSNDNGNGLLQATGDQINTDPMLDPNGLQDNGGPTLTIALQPGSPAIDAGTDLTALNGAIDDMTTGVTVTNATGIPAGVGFAIQIDSEQMIVDANSANTLTVTRGANNTTPVAHTNGAAVNPAFDQRDSGFARKVGSAVDIGAFEVQVSATPTPTPEQSPTPTPTPEQSPTPTPTPEQSPTPTPTPEQSPTPTPTPEQSPTPTPTPEQSPTPTPTPEQSPTPTPTATPAYHAQIQQPIDADGTSVFNVKRGVIPVKFTLTLNGVATCNLPSATIAVTRTAGGTIGPIGESVYSGPADNGSNFRIDSCQYIYNLGASALGVGTYRVDIIINTQVVGSAFFGLR